MEKILALSDPHYNHNWTDEKTQRFYRDFEPEDLTALVIAGDISDSYDYAQDFLGFFKDWKAKKYFVPGNHCYGWGEHSYNNRSGTCIHKLAETSGFIVPDCDELYVVKDDVLLFNLFYRSGITEEQITDTSDHLDFPIRNYMMRPDMSKIKTDSNVRFSVSHLAPNTGIPSRHIVRSPMFYNPDIDEIARAHQSKLEIFGHTHEEVDCVIDGVRYVNKPAGYGRPRGKLEDYIITVQNQDSVFK